MTCKLKNVNIFLLFMKGNSIKKIFYSENCEILIWTPRIPSLIPLYQLEYQVYFLVVILMLSQSRRKQYQVSDEMDWSSLTPRRDRGYPIQLDQSELVWTSKKWQKNILSNGLCFVKSKRKHDNSFVFLKGLICFSFCVPDLRRFIPLGGLEYAPTSAFFRWHPSFA